MNSTIWHFVRLGTTVILALMGAVSADAKSSGWTDTGQYVDWTGDDYGCSKGNRPQPKYCDKNHSGHVAVCWSGRASGWPKFPDCQGAATWCTYKKIDISSPPPATGGAPGEVWACRAAASFKDTIVVPHEFQAAESGGTLEKTTKEINSNEFQAMLTIACAAYGVDCSQAAAAIRQGAYYANQAISQANLFTAGQLLGHWGEEYRVRFLAPHGYTTCKAKIDIGKGSITGPSTFNGSIERRSGLDDIGVYAVVPKNRPSGQWARFRVHVEYVRLGKLGQYGCWPDNTVVFQCTGKDCTTYPGAKM